MKNRILERIHKGEKALALGEFDQQIDVALVACFSTRHGAKDAHFADVVLATYFDQLVGVERERSY